MYVRSTSLILLSSTVCTTSKVSAVADSLAPIKVQTPCKDVVFVRGLRAIHGFGQHVICRQNAKERTFIPALSCLYFDCSSSEVFHHYKAESHRRRFAKRIAAMLAVVAG